MTENSENKNESKRVRIVNFNDEVESLFNKGSFDFSNIIFNCEVNMDNKVFDKEVDFRDSDFRGKVSFINAKFEGSVHFDNSIFKENIRFWSAEFKGESTFLNTRFDKLADFYGVHFFLSIDFYKTNFTETAVFTEAIFNDNVFFTFSLLGNMIFRQAEFSKGIDLSLVANIDWDGNFFDIPHDFKIIVDEKLPFKRQRETFRIIKDQLIRRNNKIEALYYQGLEMMAYKAELALENGRDQEKILMWLNMSNNYGQNWVKPATLILIFNLFFPALINFSQGNCICEYTNYSSLYWQLLNPTCQIQNLFDVGTTINSSTYFLFFMSRLFLAYFIYQTISAFRKHSK